MPFSFNPTSGAQNQSGAQQGGPTFGLQSNTSGVEDVTSSDVPQAPESPFLFMAQRGQDKTAMAYVQIIAGTLFAVSIIATLVSFGYMKYLETVLESKRAEIQDKETTLKEYPYALMREEYAKLKLLEGLLKEYAAARTPLLLLEKVVENEVTFSNFSLNRDVNGKYTIQLTALTNNYKAVVQQLDALRLTEFTKVVSGQKVDKIDENSQSKLGKIKLEISAPVAIQGILPSLAVFENIVDSERAAPVANTTTISGTSSSITPAP
ncbi:MAG: hypothetical protein RI935_573 [Candidatus Parcubacteria bacterium]|jgi:hypothetical protein